MKKIMIISGAGLSAESGISTFRDSDGLWENHDVMEVCSTEGWIRDRQKVTQFYNDRRRDIESKEPNPAHIALAQLEKNYPGRVVHLSQNIDNMMEKAGAKEVIHLHGTLTDLRCEACTEIFPIGYAPQTGSESCPHCGNQRIRHNVVMFGEAAPNYRYIHESIKQCSLFIAIGTSGKVIDIVTIANEFRESILIDPKRETISSLFSNNSYIDQSFKHFIQKKAGEAMEDMMKIVKEHMEN